MDEKLKLIARVSNVAVTLSLDGSEALESLPTDQFKRLCTDAGVSDSEEAHEVVKLVCGTDLFGSTATIESLRLSVGRDHVRDLAKMLYSGWLLDATREGVNKNYDFVMMSRLFEEGRASEFAQPFSAWIGNDLTSDLRDALMPVIDKVDGSPAAEAEQEETAGQSTGDDAPEAEKPADVEAESHETAGESTENSDESETKAEEQASTDQSADDSATDTKAEVPSTDDVTEAHDTVTEQQESAGGFAQVPSAAESDEDGSSSNESGEETLTDDFDELSSQSGDEDETVPQPSQASQGPDDDGYGENGSMDAMSRATHMAPASDLSEEKATYEHIATSTNIYANEPHLDPLAGEM